MGGRGGQTLVVLTIVCAFLLLGIIALVGNTQVLFVNADRADGAALLAAQAGASAINTDALYSNTVVLNADQARQRCETAARQVPFVVGVQCNVSGNVVTANVTEQVPLPIPLLTVSETLRATRTARPAFGGHTGGF